MKLVLEINNDDMHRTIEQQLGAVISKVNDDIITKMVTDIVATKMARVTHATVDSAVDQLCQQLVRDALGSSDYFRKIKVDALLSKAAVDIVKAGLKIPG